MNKYSYMMIAASAIALASCSSQDDLFDQSKPNTPAAFSVKAVINNGDTRVSVSETTEGESTQYGLNWNANDAILVHDGTNGIKMTLDGEGGAATGTFTSDETLENVTAAFYPHSIGESAECVWTKNGEAWTVTMPDTYTYTAYTGNINCPMMAEVAAAAAEGEEADAAATLQFQHLASAIRFEIASMPEGANALTLTLPGAQVSGNFTVEYGALAATDANSGNSITIKFTSAESPVFYFPVPAGTYAQGLKLDIKQDEDVLKTYTNEKSFTLAKADMGLYPVITVGGEVEDLKAAFENGGTFKLVKDMTILDGCNYVKKDLEIDLNGHTLKTSGTAGNKEIFAYECKLTIKDSSNDKTGKITVPVFAGDIKEKSGVFKTGEVVLESGTITVDGTNACIGVGKDGKFTMEGGKLINTGANYAIGSNNLSESTNASTITINGGELESAEDYTIFIGDAQSVTISGGSLKGKCGVIAIDKGSLNVTGGTFESECTGIPNGTSGSNGFPGAIIAAPCYYGNVDVTVSGGTFKGITGISTEKQQDRITAGQGTGYTTTVAVTGGIWEDPEVLNYASDNADITVTMAADKEIKKRIVMMKGKATVDFCGHTITNKTTISTGAKSGHSYGFYIRGNANLTFEDSGSNGGITIDGSDSDIDGARQALYIYEAANVTINGGKFYNTQKINAQLDLIQVGGGCTEGENATLTINGGTFESNKYSTFGKVDGNSNPIRFWVLNKHNNCQNHCTIKVKGGTFINFNPAKPAMDDDDSYLAEGYKVEATENADVTKAYYEVCGDTNGEPTKITYTVSQQ